MVQNPKQVITAFVTLVLVSVVIWLASLVGITIDNPETIALALTVVIAFISNWLFGLYSRLKNSDGEKWTKGTSTSGKEMYIKE